MTFRARLVLAATGAVLVVVVLGSFVTYIVASNSLVGSADATLSAEAHAVLTFRGGIQTINTGCGPPVGTCYQVVAPGETFNPEASHMVLPVTSAVRVSAASQGRAPEQFSSTTAVGVDVRQIVVALPPGFSFYEGLSLQVLSSGGALQLSVPLTGVNLELRHLALALWLIVLIGVALAVLLGLGVGRTVLRPLNSLTSTVEELAETTDVSRRLDPGWPRRARPAAAGLQPAAGGARHLAGEPTAAGARRLPRAPHPTDQPQDQHGSGPTARGAGPRRTRGADRRRPHPAGRAHHAGRRPGRAGPRRSGPS